MTVIRKARSRKKMARRPAAKRSRRKRWRRTVKIRKKSRTLTQTRSSLTAKST